MINNWFTTKYYRSSELNILFGLFSSTVTFPSFLLAIRKEQKLDYTCIFFVVFKYSCSLKESVTAVKMLKHKLLLIHAPCCNMMILFTPYEKKEQLSYIESLIKISDPGIWRTDTTGTVSVNKLPFIAFLCVIKMSTKTAQSAQSANCPTQVSNYITAKLSRIEELLQDGRISWVISVLPISYCHSCWHRKAFKRQILKLGKYELELQHSVLHRSCNLLGQLTAKL